MRFRGPLVVLAVLGLGVAAGFAASRELGPEPVAVSEQRPVPAEGPSDPLGGTGAVLPDAAVPALAGDLILADERLRDGDKRVVVPVPVGWRRVDLRDGEARWLPPGDTTGGGYSVRVAVIREEVTLREMLLARRDALPGDPNITDIQRLQIDEGTSSLLATIVRDGYRKLLLIRWINLRSDVFADVEIAWTGRLQDESGMKQLLARMASGARSLGPLEQ